MDYSPRGCKESEMIERLSLSQLLYSFVTFCSHFTDALCLHLCPALDMKDTEGGTKNVWAHCKSLNIFCLTEFYPDRVISPAPMPSAITVAYFPRIKSNILTMAFITLKMRGQSLLLSSLHHTSVIPEYGHEFLPWDLCSFATGICPHHCVHQIFPMLYQDCSFQTVLSDHQTGSDLSPSLVLSQPSSAPVFYHLSHYDPQQNYLMGPALPQDCEHFKDREQVCFSLCLSQCLVQCFVQISLK